MNLMTRLASWIKEKDNKSSIIQNTAPNIGQVDSPFVVKYTWRISRNKYEILQRIQKENCRYFSNRMKIDTEYVKEIVDLKKYINIHNLMAGIRNKVIPSVSQTILMEVYSELNTFKDLLNKFDLNEVESKNIWVTLNTKQIELILTNIFDDSQSYKSKKFSVTMQEFFQFTLEESRMKSDGKNKIIFNTDKVIHEHQQAGYSIYQSILVEAQINNLCQNNNSMILNKKNDQFSYIIRQLEYWKKNLCKNYSDKYNGIMQRLFTKESILQLYLLEIPLWDEFIRDICYSFLILQNELFEKGIQTLFQNKELNQLIDQLSKKYINEQLKIDVEQELIIQMNELEELLQD